MTKENFYSDIITDLANRETYPGQLGGAKLKSVKAKSNRPPIRSAFTKAAKETKAPSKWLNRLRL